MRKASRVPFLAGIADIAKKSILLHIDVIERVQLHMSLMEVNHGTPDALCPQVGS